jgi:hypothetical protein
MLKNLMSRRSLLGQPAQYPAHKSQKQLLILALQPRNARFEGLVWNWCRRDPTACGTARFLSAGDCQRESTVKNKITLFIPVFAALFASLQKLFRGRAHQRDHLGKVQLVIEMAVFDSAE